MPPRQGTGASANSRGKAEEQPAEKSDRNREQEHMPIHRDFVRALQLARPESEEWSNAKPGKQDSDHRAGHSDNRAFRQALPRETGAAGTKGGAHRQFTVA